MEQYFVSGLTPRQLASCKQAGCGWLDYSVDDLTGALFTERELRKALTALNRIITFRFATAYEGIYGVKLSPAQVRRTHHTARCNDWDEDDLNDAAKYVAVAQEVLVPAIRRDVIIEASGGNHCAATPYTEVEPLRICIWSGPIANRDYGTPERMWGISVDDDGSYSFGPASQGISITAPDVDGPVAQLVGLTLYIFHNNYDYASEDELKIFRRICEEAAIELTMLERQRTQHRRRLVPALSRATRRQTYIERNRTRGRNFTDQLDQEAQTLQQKVAELQTALTSSLRRLAEIRTQKEVMRTHAVENSEKLYGSEFDQLSTIDRVARVDTTEEALQITTHTLHCQNPNTGNVHVLGRYRIDILLRGEEERERDSILMFNLDRRVEQGSHGNMHAPHVFGDGGACFGNIEESVSDLYANCEYVALVCLLICFLQSVNVEDSAGSYIVNWPLADTQSAKRFLARQHAA